MKMLYSVPALPVRNIERSLAFYRDKLGFTVPYQEAGFAILERDDVRIHLWTANDDEWRTRDAASPIVSGAESFIAGTASCRIAVDAIDALHETLQPLGIMHPNAPLRDQWWGSREFAVVDPDNNLITFFQTIKANDS